MTMGERLVSLVMILAFGGFGLMMVIFGIAERSLFLVILGPFVMLMSFIPLYLLTHRMRLVNQLEAHGIWLQTHFLQVYKVTHTDQKHRKYTNYQIVSEWFDAEKQMVYQFKSDTMTKDPSTYLTPDTLIPVWVDLNKPKDYIVGLESVDCLRDIYPAKS